MEKKSNECTLNNIDLTTVLTFEVMFRVFVTRGYNRNVNDEIILGILFTFISDSRYCDGPKHIPLTCPYFPKDASLIFDNFLQELVKQTCEHGSDLAV